MFELNDISQYSGILRDIAFVVVCVVVTVVALVTLGAVRKAVQRLNEAMDRVDNLIDSVAAARDTISELRDRVRSRAGMDSQDSGGGFNVVSWLLSPLGYVLKRRMHERSRARSDERSGD
ncbi:MAG: hypothetical protein OXC83_11820 [Chloroflexi bacterium]|nr:hypothetical protein [Chloroflexota bacterium]